MTKKQETVLLNAASEIVTVVCDLRTEFANSLTASHISEYNLEHKYAMSDLYDLATAIRKVVTSGKL